MTNNDIYENDDIVDDLRTVLIDCDYCGEGYALFGDNYCDNSACHEPLDEEYWREWYNEQYLELDPVSSNQIEQTIFTTSHHLCCDEVWFKCACKDSEIIEWETQYHIIDKADYELAYSSYEIDGQMAGCVTCAFWYTENCTPFRNWLRHIIKLDEFPGSIDDICQDYILTTDYDEQWEVPDYNYKSEWEKDY